MKKGNGGRFSGAEEAQGKRTVHLGEGNRGATAGQKTGLGCRKRVRRSGGDQTKENKYTEPSILWGNCEKKGGSTTGRHRGGPDGSKCHFCDIQRHQHEKKKTTRSVGNILEFVISVRKNKTPVGQRKGGGGQKASRTYFPTTMRPLRKYVTKHQFPESEQSKEKIKKWEEFCAFLTMKLRLLVKKK